MKRSGARAIVVLGVCLVSQLIALTAKTPIGLSLGTFEGASLSPGTHVMASVVLPIGSYFEMELFGVAMATPQPGSESRLGAACTVSLLGPMTSEGGQVPTYATTLLSLGWLADIQGRSWGGPFVRLVPIATGGPEFVVRERALGIGVQYDLQKHCTTIFFNLLIVDLYGR